MKSSKTETKIVAYKNKIIESLKKTYGRFLKIRGNPHEIALGMALGLFIGMTPTVGFQMAVAVFFAALFKWNKLSAAMGCWISNPATLWLYIFTYKFGAFLLGIDGKVSPPVGFSLEMILKMPKIFLITTFGGIVIGIPIAIGGYYFSYFAVKKYQDGIKRKLVIQKEKLSQRKQLKARKKSIKKQAK